MLLTFTGLLLLLSPLLLLSKFKDLKVGFAAALSLSITFNLVVAILTQFFGIFNYLTVLIPNIVLSSIVVWKIREKVPRKIDAKNISKAFWKIDFALIFLVMVGTLFLSSVHYNYSGKYITSEDKGELKTAHNLKYPYPYFADEWYSVALIKNSIASQALPTKNPFYVDIPQNVLETYYVGNYDQSNLNTYYFNNLELPFHSYLSQLTLLLKLDPVKNYTLLSTGINLTILILIYVFLRSNRISKLTASIATLSALFITSGANLPGLWNLIPLNMGIVTLLLSFIFLETGAQKMARVSGFLSLIFYPPLVVFLLPAFLAKAMKPKHAAHNFLVILIAAFFISVLFFISFGKSKDFLGYILPKIYFLSLNGSFLIDFKPYKVIPIPILLLAAAGVYTIAKKMKWMLPVMSIGLLYWLIYSFTSQRFIIEYQRVITVTSLLIVIYAAFGIEWLKKLLDATVVYKQKPLTNYLLVPVMLSFMLLYPTYTQRENWAQLTASDPQTGDLYLPAPPANTYLLPDDLRIFKKFQNKPFLSLPWKSTVIAVATGNIPRTIKSGTLTLHPNLYSEFTTADCAHKAEFAKYYYFNLVYTPAFDCKEFELQDQSPEGLFLYKFINQDYFPE